MTHFRDLSERTGVPMELLKVVRELFGFAEPRPEDYVRVDEMSVVPVIEALLSSGVRPIGIERFTAATKNQEARLPLMS